MNPKKDTDQNLAIALTVSSLFTQHGKTLAETFAATGLSIASLSRINNFQKRLTFYEACLLCDFFGISLSQFQALMNEKLTDERLLADFRALQAMQAAMKSRL